MNRRRDSLFIYLFLFIFLVQLVGYLIRYLVYPDLRIGTGRSLVIMLALIPAYYAAIIFHEGGHVLFGALARLKFIWMSIGKLQLYTDARYQLRMRFAKHLNFLSGFAAMTTNNERFLRWRYFIFVLGGPLGNIVLCILMLFSYIYTPPGSFLRVTMVTTIPISLLTAVLSLIPYRTRGLPNDGLHIIHFLLGRREMRRTIAITLLYGAARAGAGSKEWEARWIEDAVAIQDNSATEAIANIYAHDWALDKKSSEIAESHLNRALGLVEKLDVSTATLVYWQQAYYLAMYKNDAVAARAAFEKVDSNPLALAYYPLRTEASVLLAEKRFEEAKVKALEGTKAYRELGSPKHGQEEFDQLEDILAKAELSLTSLSFSTVA